MQVEVVSPERVLFSGEATMVITRTLERRRDRLPARSAPFLGALTENHTRVFLADGSIQDIAVHGGFVEVSDNKVSILSDMAELAGHRRPARSAIAPRQDAAGGATTRPPRPQRATARLRRRRGRASAAGLATKVHLPVPDRRS